MLIFSGSAFAKDPELKIALENLGYTIVAVSAPKLREWEMSFGMIEKREYAIRRNRRIPGKPARYYRFIVKVEEYGSQEEAETRAYNILATPPGPDSKQTGPEFDLRYGFRIEKKVYVVSTDVYAIVADGTLGSVTSKLEDWVRDAVE